MVIIRIKFSAYTVPATLGTAGILFMEVFNEVLKMAATESPETVENISHNIWQILVDWLFELK